MKNKYYLHRSTGFAGDYFGEIGEPYEVSFFWAYLMKIFGYRMTKAPEDKNLTEVWVKAAIEAGAHPTSYAVQKIRETKYRLKKDKGLTEIELVILIGIIGVFTALIVPLFK